MIEPRGVAPRRRLSRPPERHPASRDRFLILYATGAIDYPANTPIAVNAAQKAVHGIYAALIRYGEDYPGAWDFV